MQIMLLLNRRNTLHFWRWARANQYWKMLLLRKIDVSKFKEFIKSVKQISMLQNSKTATK
jgi:hypothetical protein